MLLVNGCTTVVQSATNGMAANLNAAILNQDDPETVRDGAPAYLLMLDSFVEGSPDDAAMLAALLPSRIVPRSRSGWSRRYCARRAPRCPFVARFFSR